MTKSEIKQYFAVDTHEEGKPEHYYCMIHKQRTYFCGLNHFKPKKSMANQVYALFCENL